MAAQSKIVTFYSYKGGVGRSMALANVAWLLAAKYGKKVLVVDWDLEAPGLHRFFKIDPKRIDVGLIDLFEIYKSRLKETEGSLPKKLVDLSSALIEVPLKEAVDGGSLFLIGAGKQDADYVKRVNSFDWNDFYDTWHGFGFFEYLKTELKRTAEIILLDSRTGVTDIGGICTLQLPDVVVLLFALNEQNISGTELIAESIIKNAPDLSENATTPTIMIRPARVEKYLEQDKKNDWEVKAAARLQKYLPESESDPLKFLKQNSIPYIGAYSFGETPLACESVARQADEPGVSFDSLTLAILKICGLWTESTSERLVLSVSYLTRRQILTNSIYLLLIATGCMVAGYVLWPRLDPSSGVLKNSISIFGKTVLVGQTTRLILIALASAGLGGYTASMNRLLINVGQQTRPSLASLYFQPVIGMMVGFALLVALSVIVQVSPSQISIYGMVGISLLVGLFSNQLYARVEEFWKTLFLVKRN